MPQNLRPLTLGLIVGLLASTSARGQSSATTRATPELLRYTLGDSPSLWLRYPLPVPGGPVPILLPAATQHMPDGLAVDPPGGCRVTFIPKTKTNSPLLRIEAIPASGPAIKNGWFGFAIPIQQTEDLPEIVYQSILGKPGVGFPIKLSLSTSVRLQNSTGAVIRRNTNVEIIDGPRTLKFKLGVDLNDGHGAWIPVANRPEMTRVVQLRLPSAKQIDDSTFGGRPTPFRCVPKLTYQIAAWPLPSGTVVLRDPHGSVWERSAVTGGEPVLLSPSTAASPLIVSGQAWTPRVAAVRGLHCDRRGKLRFNLSPLPGFTPPVTQCDVLNPASVRWRIPGTYSPVARKAGFVTPSRASVPLKGKTKMTLECIPDLNRRVNLRQVPIQDFAILRAAASPTEARKLSEVERRAVEIKRLRSIPDAKLVSNAEKAAKTLLKSGALPPPEPTEIQTQLGELLRQLHQLEVTSLPTTPPTRATF